MEFTGDDSPTSGHLQFTEDKSPTADSDESNSPMAESVPTSFEEILGTTFIGKSGPVEKSSFAGKHLMIYFSAHWCPPCRRFTPKLIKYVNDRRAAGHDDLEVIFASSDNSEREFNEYYSDMPWLAFPHKDKRIQQLSSKFQVEGIPTLILFDPEGNIVTNNGTGCVDRDPEGLKFPYPQDLVVDIEDELDSFGCNINSKLSLLCLMHSLDAEAQASAKAVLATFAVTLAQEKAKTPSGPEMIFFCSLAPGRGGALSAICQMTELDEDTDLKSVQLVLLDIPDSGGYYKCSVPEVTQESVGHFIESYRNKTLQRAQLSRRRGGG